MRIMTLCIKSFSLCRLPTGLCLNKQLPSINQACSVSSDSGHRVYDTKSPYKDIKNYAPYRVGYENKQWSGGLRPRVKSGRFKDKRVKGMPHIDYIALDEFRKEVALQGQNDYIDILGDGRISPVDLYDGPEWLRGFRGNELQRIVRQLEFARVYMREMKPFEYHLMQKRLWFMFKKMNRTQVPEFYEEHPEKHWSVLPGRFQGRFDRWNTGQGDS